jgi:hypothetical protein
LEKNAEAELRLCRIARCDPGEGLRTIDRPEPLTPTLSHKQGERELTARVLKYEYPIRILKHKKRKHR